MKARHQGLVVAAVCAALAASHALAASPVIVDATGRVLAFYLGRTQTEGEVYAISTQGYVIKFVMKTGVVSVLPGNAAGTDNDASPSAVYFAGLGCTGATYFVINNGTSPPYLGGYVFRSAFDNAHWYVPKAAAHVTPTVLSARDLDNGNCFPAPPGGTYVPVLPNDPAITGFSAAPVVAPLRIEVATINDPSGLLLRDGFETAT